MEIDVRRCLSFESAILSTQIQVANLGKAIVRAGALGSDALPPQAEATKEGPENARFTVIGNRGANNLAKAEL